MQTPAFKKIICLIMTDAKKGLKEKMKEYDPSELKHLQQVVLSIYKDFLTICEEKQLKWFTFAGTAIGALRHGGFIPWDDDIDVCLPRYDYEVLLSSFKEKFPDKYIIMNADEYPAFPLTTTRIMLKGTVFREESLKDITCPLGIFLDVYPFDPVSDNEKQYKSQAKKAWYLSKLLILCSVKRPVIKQKGIKAGIIYAACYLLHAFLKITGIKPSFVYKKCKKTMMKYHGVRTKRIAYLCDTNPYWNTISYKDLYPLRKVEFEDTYVNLPKNAERFISRMWPDFMIPPKEEDRHTHCPDELDFGKY